MFQRVRSTSVRPNLCCAGTRKYSATRKFPRRPAVDPEDKRLSKTLNSLVQIAKRGDRQGGYTYTHTRGAEKQRLENALATTSNPKGGYLQDNVVFYGEQDDTASLEDLLNSLQSGPVPAPGSFVELRKCVITIAVYLSTSSFILLQGRCSHTRHHSWKCP